MNQILIIRHLNYSTQGQEKIFEKTLNGFITTDAMIRYGMWACNVCGHVNSVDDSGCVCGEEKFIVRQEIEPLFKPEIIRPPLVVPFVEPYIPKRQGAYRRKAIIDILTGWEYPSLTDAAKAHGLTPTCLYQRLKSKSQRLTNLRYKV